jgi:hypothetical protein
MTTMTQFAQENAVNDEVTDLESVPACHWNVIPGQSTRIWACFNRH